MSCFSNNRTSPPKVVLFHKIIHKYLLEQRVRLLLHSLSDISKIKTSKSNRYMNLPSTYHAQAPYQTPVSPPHSTQIHQHNPPLPPSLPPSPPKIPTHLESHREPHIPQTVPLDIRQVQWRVQRLASFWHPDQKLLMRFVQAQESAGAVAFLLGRDVLSEAERCDSGDGRRAGLGGGHCEECEEGLGGEEEAHRDCWEGDV